ncbi:hypothetical protein PAHAL_3G106900 [Panicum hallii]|uniref:Uncharacterized protein n=1 Tax=Panicum hallii TaxID=206008 RepID=A0A2S3H7X5_9POAL|nr:hypothetical protein PAHAL_3G106900 [Panicum hallii]
MQLASGPHSVWRYDGCGTGDWRPLSIDVRPFVVGSKVLDSKKFVWALIYQSDAHMGGLGWGVGLVVKIGFKFKCLNAAGATNQQWYLGKSRCLRSRVPSGWTSEHETMSNLRWEEPASPKFWRSLWAAHGAPTTDFLMVSADQHGRPSNPGEGEGH